MFHNLLSRSSDRGFQAALCAVNVMFSHLREIMCTLRSFAERNRRKLQALHRVLLVSVDRPEEVLEHPRNQPQPLAQGVCAGLAAPTPMAAAAAVEAAARRRYPKAAACRRYPGAHVPHHPGDGAGSGAVTTGDLRVQQGGFAAAVSGGGASAQGALGAGGEGRDWSSGDLRCGRWLCRRHSCGGARPGRCSGCLVRQLP